MISNAYSALAPARFRSFNASCLFACIASLSGCAERPSVDIEQLVNYHTCTGLEVGAQWISWAEVAQARNLKYIDTPLAAPPGRFLAISNGEQPSGGYRLELESIESAWFTPVLRFDLSWHVPAADEAVTMMITSPCLIFNIDTTDRLAGVEVTLDGEPFANLAE